MLKMLLLVAGMSLMTVPSLAQKNLAWPMLGLTTYDQNPNTGAYKPKFPSLLEAQYEGQEVIISGYLIPIDVEAQRYALSKNPFSSCFFCGNAGPETVVELKFESSPGRFATDKYLPIKGILRLNRHVTNLFFTIEKAQVAG